MSKFKVPENLRFTKDHEWADISGGKAIVGITEFAKDALGEVVYVELPEVGTKIRQMEAFGVVESVKAVSDLYSPFSGTIIEVNTELRDRVDPINQDVYGSGWMIKIELNNQEEIKNLLNSEAYKNLISESH